MGSEPARSDGTSLDFARIPSRPARQGEIVFFNHLNSFIYLYLSSHDENFYMRQSICTFDIF